MIESIRKKTIFWSFISVLLSIPIALLGTRANYPLTCTADDRLIETQADTPAIKVSDRGTALLDNKPFFPLGFYHVSWQASNEERSRHLEEIADAGFNTIHVSFDTTDAPANKSAKIEQYAKFLQEAETFGIKVLTEFDPKERLMLVNDLKNQPAILGWNIADDVDNGRLTPTKVLDFHCQLKKADSRHLTYISGYSEREISDYVNTADAIGVQAYPVGDKRDRTFDWPNHMITIADAAAHPDRLIIGNVQAFRWDKDNPAAVENPPIPTFKQIRNMTYQSLVGGAKGIIFYTAYAEDWNILEHPQLWQKVKSLVPEIDRLKPMLLEGKLNKLETEAENILAGVWTLDTRKVAIVVNTSNQDTTEVALNFPGGKARSIFNHKTEEVEIERGQLIESLEPLEVRVYELLP